MWPSLIIAVIIFALAVLFLRTGKMPIMSTGDWITRAERPVIYWLNMVIILIFAFAAAGMAAVVYFTRADQ